MSVTVGLVPTLLIYAIARGNISATIAEIGAARTIAGISENNEYSENYHFTIDEIRELQEKEIETVFVDKDTLIKTLEDYGADITVSQADKIECSVEDFEFSFYKTGDNLTPYKLKIKYNEEGSLKNLIEDINSGYISNTQEASYNKVIERLEAKNMNWEEEIYDDDTIVLTVNLD